MDLRICFFICLHCKLYQMRICRECARIHSWHLPDCISKYGCVHIMMYRICRNHHITNVNSCIQGSCNTCIDQRIYAKFIHQDLRTDCRINFTDSTSYDNRVLPTKSSFIKCHGSKLCHFSICHLTFQSCNFLFHCSNNTYHPIFLLLCIFTVRFPHISFIRLPFSLSLQTFPVILYIIPYPMHKCQALIPLYCYAIPAIILLVILFFYIIGNLNFSLQADSSLLKWLLIFIYLV